MNKSIITLTIIMGIGIYSSCVSASLNDDVSKTSSVNHVEIKPSNRDKSFIIDDAVSLCNRLSEMKRMPNKDDVANDLIYDGLKEKGREAIPCLVEKITDTTLMDDPREAPHIYDFTVGDAATFMLHKMTNEPLEEILPPNIRKRWETEGVYAYFAYVEKKQNREKIQLWWKDWMKKNLN